MTIQDELVKLIKAKDPEADLTKIHNIADAVKVLVAIAEAETEDEETVGG